jgi:hypothetical protein
MQLGAMALGEVGSVGLGHHDRFSVIVVPDHSCTGSLSLPLFLTLFSYLHGLLHTHLLLVYWPPYSQAELPLFLHVFSQMCSLCDCWNCYY